MASVFHSSVPSRSTTVICQGLKMPRELSINDPPYFPPGADLFEWHKKVVKWVQLLKAPHNSGNDRTYHTLFKILEQTLYARGLPSEHQAIVDEAQSKGIIDNTQTRNPVKAVLVIVKVIAVDPPNAKVTRLITSFNRVTS